MTSQPPKPLAKPVTPVQSQPTSLIASKPWILEIGQAGIGKTTLAATSYKPLFVDMEDGAAHVVSPERRIRYTGDESPIDFFEKHLQDLIKCKYDPDKKVLLYKDIEVGTLVIDTLDAMQKFLQSMIVKRETVKMKENARKWGRPMTSMVAAMEQRAWGELLNALQMFVPDLVRLRIPIVIVCHAKEYQPKYNIYHEDQLEKPGSTGVALAGSIDDIIMGWCSYVIVLKTDKTGARWMIYAPIVFEDFRIQGKDRGGLKELLHNDTQAKLTQGGFRLENLTAKHTY